MNIYSYQEAKAIIQAICDDSKNGVYDTRESFFSMLEKHPDLAVQGYNTFGKIFYWNPASVRLYGYREDLAVNQNLFDLILPEEIRPLARDMVQRAAETGRLQEPASCDLLHRDGSFVTVFSGHLMFRWQAAVPEFYCIDLCIETVAS